MSCWLAGLRGLGHGVWLYVSSHFFVHNSRLCYGQGAKISSLVIFVVFPIDINVGIKADLIV